MANDFEGILTAQVTPFTGDYELDEDVLCKHIDFLIQSGIRGLVTTAGAGEFVNLTDEERKRVLELTVKEARRRVPIIMGILSIGTRHSLHLLKYANSVGADGALVLPPYYIRPSTEGIYSYFEELATSGLPIILYNNPPRTGVNLDPSIVERLMRINGIVGIKECNRDLAQFCEMVRIARGGEFSVLSGDDDYLYAGLVHGSKGAIMAETNLAPKPFLRIYEEFRKGNIEEARKEHFRLLPLFKALRIQNHPGPLKEAMEMIGRPVGPARKPLHPMTGDERQRVRAALESLGML